MGPILKRIIEHNQEQSERFTSPGVRLRRQAHRHEHPTEIVAFECMDGRVNVAKLTNKDVGTLRSIRNLGGVFEIGWPALNLMLMDFVDWSASQARPVLFISTYHYSKGDSHRGCRGHEYDLGKAQDSAEHFRHQLQTAFGREFAYPILLGVETDTQSLILHGQNGRVVSVANITGHPTIATICDIVRDLWPDMNHIMIKDLANLIEGNLQHVRDVAQAHQPLIYLDHTEQVIAVGHGFDWLHLPNFALMINDADPMLDDAIVKAIGIIKENRDHGRIPHQQGALYLAAVAYEQPGFRRQLAMAQARHLMKLGQQMLKRERPELQQSFQLATAIINWDLRKLELISSED